MLFGLLNKIFSLFGFVKTVAATYTSGLVIINKFILNMNIYDYNRDDRDAKPSNQKSDVHISLDRLTSSSRIRLSYAYIQEKSGSLEKFAIFLSYLICIIFFPISIFMVFVAVREFERLVIFRNGKLSKPRTYGPGLVCYLPCIDSIKFIDLRIISYIVRPQEALTKDSLTCTVDAVVYYRIEDPIKALINVADYKGSTKFIAATTLRTIIGTRKLNEILKDRRAISNEINEHLKPLTSKWGVSVLRVEIKDINFPLHMQKTMATEAESSRLANAKIKVAKAEIDCAKSLLEATNLLLEYPAGIPLRYLQALQHIAGDKTQSVILPFSVSAINKILNGQSQCKYQY